MANRLFSGWLLVETAVAFMCSNYNKYSISALAGAIESTPATGSTPLYYLNSKKLDAAVDMITALAKTNKRILVCFSFATINIPHVFEVLGLLKGELSHLEITYMAGGPHATGDPEGTIALGFDIAVTGEAEESFPELIETFSADTADWKKVDGIAYLHNGSVIKTGKRRAVDLNNFAPFSIKSGRLSPIEISRGCPHACRFCQTSFIFGGRMRHRSIDEVIKHIELGRAYGSRDFRFISPNALAYGSEDGRTVDLEKIERLLRRASKITGRDLLFFGSFPSEVRPEAVSKEALELITGFTATKQLVIGAQTGSQRMLDALHREHSVEDIYRAVRLTVDANLKVSVDFIFGLPGETKRDRQCSIEMIDRLAGMGARIHSHTFIPLPGTPLAGFIAGTVDEELARHLSRLANKGLQFGQWQKQQEMAKEASIFRQEINA